MLQQFYDALMIKENQSHAVLSGRLVLDAHITHSHIIVCYVAFLLNMVKMQDDNMMKRKRWKKGDDEN